MPVKSALKILLSLAVGAVCTYLVVRNMDRAAVMAAFGRVSAGAIGLYLVTVAVTHFFRAIRWRYLLRPIGVELPRGQLLAVSSVGFMAILALPIRLGEFVRPYYVVQSGQSRMSAVLGTVAVERVVDGLLVSMLLFGTYLAAPAAFSMPIEVLGGATLEYFAWLSLLVFVSATIVLAVTLTWREHAVRFFLRVSLLDRLAPAFAARLGDRLLALIRGFLCLRRPRDLVPFVLQSLVYWGSNGLGVWLLANAMGLPLSFIAAYAAMAFTAVVITLPNSPGLVGQFQVGMVAVVAAFLGTATGNAEGLAYAIVLHAVQVVWYLTVGVASVRFAGTGRSLRDVVRASNDAVGEAPAAAASEPAPSLPNAML